MLLKMKEGLSKPVVYGIVIILIAGFALWGVGDFTRSNLGEPLASVGRTNIYPSQFSRTFRNALQNVMRQNPDMTYEGAKKAGLDKSILEQLTQRAAFDELLRHMGLVIDPQRIRAFFQEYDNFLTPLGALDENRVRNYALENGYTSLQELIDETGNTILREDLLTTLTAGMALPMWIQNGILQIIVEERQVDYATILPADLPQRPPPPTEDDIITYYTQYSQLLVSPERRSFHGLFLDANAIGQAYEPLQEDIVLFYEAYRTTFGTPEMRSLNLITFPDEQSARAFLANVSGNEGEFYTHLQKALLKQPSIRNIILDDVTLEDLKASGEHIAKETFRMELMTLKGPFEGIIGPSVIYLNKIIPSSIPPLADVRDKIISSLLEDEKKHALSLQTQNVEDAILDGHNLAEIAQRYDSLQFFSLEDILKNFLPDVDSTLPQNLDITVLVDHAFSSVVGALPEPINLTREQRAWLMVSNIKPARPLSLEEARPIIVQILQKQRDLKNMETIAQEVIEKSKQKPFKDVLKAVRLVPQTSTFINRLTTTSGSFDLIAIGKIFALPKEHVTFAPTSSGDALLLFQIKEIKQIQIPTDTKLRIKKQLTLSFLRETFDAFSQTLKLQYGSWKDDNRIDDALATPNPY